MGRRRRDGPPAAHRRDAAAAPLADPAKDVWAFAGWGIVSSAAILLLGLALTTRRPDNPIG